MFRPHSRRQAWLKPRIHCLNVLVMLRKWCHHLLFHTLSNQSNHLFSDFFFCSIETGERLRLGELGFPPTYSSYKKLGWEAPLMMLGNLCGMIWKPLSSRTTVWPLPTPTGTAGHLGTINHHWWSQISCLWTSRAHCLENKPSNSFLQSFWGLRQEDALKGIVWGNNVSPFATVGFMETGCGWQRGLTLPNTASCIHLLFNIFVATIITGFLVKRDCSFYHFALCSLFLLMVVLEVAMRGSAYAGLKGNWS